MKKNKVTGTRADPSVCCEVRSVGIGGGDSGGECLIKEGLTGCVVSVIVFCDPVLCPTMSLFCCCRCCLRLCPRFSVFFRLCRVSFDFLLDMMSLKTSSHAFFSVNFSVAVFSASMHSTEHGAISALTIHDLSPCLPIFCQLCQIFEGVAWWGQSSICDLTASLT